jgi:heme/copper-type cytochrome/quinol oxidase subunit 2
VAALIVFVITQSTPLVMVGLLVVALYLVWVDVKDEPVDFQIKAWWFLFVLLTHVIGYLVFRVWIAARRHRRKQEAHAASPGPRGRRGGGPA